MEHYLCINGKKTELTAEQVRELGFATDAPADVYTVARLSEIVKSGKAREHFSVNDVFTLGNDEVKVIGFDHDKVKGRDELHTITLMFNTLIPDRRWHSGSCERGWIDSEIRKYLNGEFYAELSDELTVHILAAEKITHNYDGEAFTTSDLLFIPSESELFGSAIYAAAEDGARYEAFATSNDRIMRDDDGDERWYWTRSALGGSSSNCCYVNSDGNSGNNSGATTSFAAPVCFTFA